VQHNRKPLALTIKKMKTKSEHKASGKKKLRQILNPIKQSALLLPC